MTVLEILLMIGLAVYLLWVYIQQYATERNFEKGHRDYIKKVRHIISQRPKRSE